MEHQTLGRQTICTSKPAFYIVDCLIFCGLLRKPEIYSIFFYTETSPILLPQCVSYSLLVLLLKFYYERRRRSCVGPLSRFLLFPKVVVYKSCVVLFLYVQYKINTFGTEKWKSVKQKKNYNIEADLIWLRIKVDLQLNRQTTGFKMRCLFA